MALDASDMPVLSPEEMVLRDSAAAFRTSGQPRMFAADIAAHLREMTEIELYDTLTDRGLAQLMAKALGPSQAMTLGNERSKGFHARPVLAAWKRAEVRLEPAYSPGEEEDEYDQMFTVTDVTDVTDYREAA
jgi:hypothetical protein